MKFISTSLPNAAFILAVAMLIVAVAFFRTDNAGALTCTSCVDGGDIKDGTLKSIDIYNSSITGIDIKSNSIGSIIAGRGSGKAALMKTLNK